MALITMEEGEVLADLLKSELARILLIDWEWDVQEHGDNAYVVPFPCKVELDRVVAIRNITTKHKEGVLLFEEHNLEIKPLRHLDKVCVRVFGYRTRLDHFSHFGWWVPSWELLKRKTSPTLGGLLFFVSWLHC